MAAVGPLQLSACFLRDNLPTEAIADTVLSKTRPRDFIQLDSALLRRLLRLLTCIVALFLGFCITV